MDFASLRRVDLDSRLRSAGDPRSLSPFSCARVLAYERPVPDSLSLAESATTRRALAAMVERDFQVLAVLPQDPFPPAPINVREWNGRRPTRSRYSTKDGYRFDHFAKPIWVPHYHRKAISITGTH